MTPQELSLFIRAQAKALGADLVGFAPAQPPEEDSKDRKAFQDWIAADMHGTMAYMARDMDVRWDITRWFPPAKSVILLAYSYGARDTGEPNDGGSIARYARSKDYHEAIRERLKTLLQRITATEPQARGKIFVDTSAVLERRYGRHAGMGWIGKNTMLVSRHIGSYFFLSGLALDQELIYDKPLADHCGGCDRCMAACPTKALTGNRVLDASRCIAYLTIEHRGAVPERWRGSVGNQVFGCDICQQACPWNRFSATHALFPPLLPGEIPLERLASMSEEEFDRTFGDTPVERAGHQGIRRNALLAMGNSGNARHIRILERSAEDPDPVISEQARWSLKQLKNASMTSEPCIGLVTK